MQIAQIEYYINTGSTDRWIHLSTSCHKAVVVWPQPLSPENMRYQYVFKQIRDVLSEWQKDTVNHREALLGIINKEKKSIKSF